MEKKKGIDVLSQVSTCLRELSLSPTLYPHNFQQRPQDRQYERRMAKPPLPHVVVQLPPLFTIKKVLITTTSIIKSNKKFRASQRARFRVSQRAPFRNSELPHKPITLAITTTLWHQLLEKLKKISIAIFHPPEDRCIWSAIYPPPRPYYNCGSNIR